MTDNMLPEWNEMNEPPIQEQPEFIEFLRTLKTNIEYLKSRGDYSLEIGTVTSGVSPSATITGDPPNQTLNLVLVPGADGADGDPGEEGPPGADGPGPGGASGDVQVNDGAGAFGGITGVAGVTDYYVLASDGTTVLRFEFDRGVLTEVNII